MYFTLRTCPPPSFIDAQGLFDNTLRHAMNSIVTLEGSVFRELQWRICSLPIKSGGLGIYSVSDAIHFAYLASMVQSVELHDFILRGCEDITLGAYFTKALDRFQAILLEFDSTRITTKGTVPPKSIHLMAEAYFSGVSKGLREEFDLGPRDLDVLGCLRAPHAHDFLLAIPIEGLGQCMSPTEYRVIIKYRLLIHLYREGKMCPGFKYRHDLVSDVLYDIIWKVGISDIKEAPVNFLTNPYEERSTLMPAGVLVYSCSGGKHACVDLTRVSSLVGFDIEEFTVGHVATTTVASKVEKHEKVCQDNQYSFIPFAFDTFEFLATESIELLRFG